MAVGPLRPRTKRRTRVVIEDPCWMCGAYEERTGNRPRNTCGLVHRNKLHRLRVRARKAKRAGTRIPRPPHMPEGTPWP